MLSKIVLEVNRMVSENLDASEYRKNEERNEPNVGSLDVLCTLKIRVCLCVLNMNL